MQALMFYSQAREALEKASKMDEIKDIRDKAEALRLYTKQAGEGLEMQNWCAEIKLRAERRAGELLRDIPREQGKRTDRTSLEDQTKFVSTIGHLDISTETAHRWQTIAAMPEPAFEAYVATTKAEGKELTSAGVYRLAHQQRKPEPVITPPFPDQRYRCLVIDPPWPMEKILRDERPRQGLGLDYPTMTIEEIGKLPIHELADEGCHVYLWVTHRFLPEGLRLFEQWGVAYQCLLTWVKNVGMTPFSWMYDTEHALFGRIGHLPLVQNGLRLSIVAAANGHSIKPESFYDRVRAASPEPRLDLFSRRPIEGFDAWGHDATKLS